MEFPLTKQFYIKFIQQNISQTCNCQNKKRFWKNQGITIYAVNMHT